MLFVSYGDDIHYLDNNSADDSGQKNTLLHNLMIQISFTSTL